jgi:hypothetical protein
MQKNGGKNLMRRRSIGKPGIERLGCQLMHMKVKCQKKSKKL